MTRRLKVAVVYGVPAGAGGLGQQVASILHALAPHYEVHALGPGRAEAWPLPTAVPALEWHRAPACVARWRIRYTWLRRRAGRLQLLNDRRIGVWAVAQMSRLQPDFCYVFTQVGLETLQWARASGVTSILESPNGHLRNYREVCLRESRRRGARTFHLHPSLAMLSRVESEYALADRIRVSSEWSKASLVEHGLDRRMIEVFQQPLNLSRFQPPPAVPSGNGPLRICFVGSLDLRKGFVYLLQAIRRMGAERVSLEIVGATGDRLCRRLLAREGAGLMLRHAPGDPLPALQRAELMVSPTLEDGQPYTVAEAMACGLPVITTECCGASEWIRPGKTGWIVPGADVDALVAALEDAIRRRDQLHEMGAAARRDTERRADMRCLEPLREWIRSITQPERPRLTA